MTTDDLLRATAIALVALHSPYHVQRFGRVIREQCGDAVADRLRVLVSDEQRRRNGLGALGAGEGA